MKPTLIWVHGINHSTQERAALPDMLRKRLETQGCANLFGDVHVATWRSLGGFFEDIHDLSVNEQRFDEAVEDVRAQIAVVDGPQLVIAHSMGQPLAVNAIAGLRNVTTARSLLTVGGPMGNGFARFWPNFLRMNQSLWANPPSTLGLREWRDVWSPEDPVNGAASYRAFLAAQSVRMNPFGSPTPLTPLSEHGAYFTHQPFWALVREMVARLSA